ncbi:DUF4153 domain-containing protein [Sphingomonas canadensis]|uniref:DUF4153 domain-containing protein n=1 Tax=Sphingomonas canadensis TaxID=1219257 RepID=A0ABW3H466_9SPHN|nr:DUF4153 domain-containing protein [Sphingomonas canadensis]MCW3835509.1 DUF4153 domain-containing protein [Sphingomonas canadensis]
MNLRELIGVIGWQGGAAADAIARAAQGHPEWRDFADPAAADPEAQLPDALVSAALAQAGVPLAWQGGFLRPRDSAPRDESLVAIEAAMARTNREAMAQLQHKPEIVPQRDKDQPAQVESRSMETAQEADWEAHDDGDAEDGGLDWNWRPVALALLGLATGVGVHLILRQDFDPARTHWQLIQLVALVVTAGMIGFTVERRSWILPLVFAVATGAVAAAVTWWNGPPHLWEGSDGWRLFALFLAIAIAAPLFQAAHGEGAPSFPYPAVHDHAWTNVVLWVACWVFVGVVFLLMWLLAALFNLIELTFLRELLEKDWFIRALTGLAFGTGLGVLRDHDAVVRLLQRVVATVLAVLAPVLAIGLAVFLGALPFTGLSALWGATDHATPVLLSCVIGALILANAVIGNSDEQESRIAVLRWGSLALAVVILPLVALAALGTGLRISQYGFTPDRLWAATFVGIAALYGIAYWVSLVRGRLEWQESARPANLGLAFVVLLVSLVLATPLVSFNAISVQDQLARLESGKVAPDKFDWAALAFDFGQPGRDALEKLKASPNAAIKAKAVEAAKSDNRWGLDMARQQVENAGKVTVNARMLPAGAKLPDGLRDTLADAFDCVRDSKCTVLMVSPAEAIVLSDSCYAVPEPEPTPAPAPDKSQPKLSVAMPVIANSGCQGGTRYRFDGKAWERANWQPQPGQPATAAAGFKDGKVEVRTVPRRQLFVGGVPVGEPFE